MNPILSILLLSISVSMKACLFIGIIYYSSTNKAIPNYLLNLSYSISYNSIYYYSKLQLSFMKTQNAVTSYVKDVPFLNNLLTYMKSDSNLDIYTYTNVSSDLTICSKFNEKQNLDYKVILHYKPDNEKIKYIEYSKLEQADYKFIMTEITVDDKKIVVHFTNDKYNYLIVHNKLDNDFINYLNVSNTLIEHQLQPHSSELELGAPQPKKTKIVKEGIVDTAANAKVRIFSSIDRKKKELYKNAVKEDMQEAVTVKKEKYSWGKMMTVHHGSDTSYPLHPEHQQAIAKLGDGEKTSFKDETNSSVHAEREGDTVHLTRPRLSSTKTSVAHSHFNEEFEQGVVEGSDYTSPKLGTVKANLMNTQKPTVQVQVFKHNTLRGDSYWVNKEVKVHKTMDQAQAHVDRINKQGVAEENLSELKKSTLSSYIKKAAYNATSSAYDAGGESQRHAGEPVSKRPDTYGADRKVALKRLAGIGKATDRLEKNVNEEWTKTGKTGTHIASGEKTFEWAKVDSEGKKTGERHYRNAAGKVMGEETEQIAELNKDTVYSYAAKAEKDVDKKHKELISQIKTNNPLSANKTSSKIVKRYAGMDRAETRLNKEETEQGVAEGLSKQFEIIHLDQSGERKRKIVSGTSKEAAARQFKKQYKLEIEHVKQLQQGVAEENIVETKGAPKGFHFTKDGKLKRGDADQDGNGGPMLRTDPLDKQRNKVPAVSEGIDFFKVWESIKPVEAVVEEETVDPVALKKEADRIMELNIAARKAK